MNHVGSMRITAESEIKNTQPKQAHGGYRETHDGAAEKCDRQCGRRPALGCCGGRSDIRPGRGEHPNVPRRTGSESTNEKRDGGFPAKV